MKDKVRKHTAGERKEPTGYFEYAAITTAGTRGSSNQDRVMIEGNLLREGVLSGKCQGYLLAILCDGVGGVEHGERAADMAAVGLRDACNTAQDPFTLCRALHVANEQLFTMNDRGEGASPEYLSTVAALYLSETSHYVMNAGDTRVYRAFSGELEVLSTDHVLSKEVGQKTFAHSGDTSSRHKEVITQCLGQDTKSLSLGMRGSTERPLLDGIYLVCSDGVYKYLREEDICAVLSSDLCLHEKCRSLIADALAAGTQDDLSVIVVEYATEGTS